MEAKLTKASYWRGNVPPRLEFWATSSTCNLLKFAISEGRVPVKKLVPKLMRLSMVRLPSSVGMVPFSSLSLSQISTVRMVSTMGFVLQGHAQYSLSLGKDSISKGIVPVSIQELTRRISVVTNDEQLVDTMQQEVSTEGPLT